MINLDQKYESYVRNGEKKIRIDGIQERVRGYGYTDDGKDINGYYLLTDNYTFITIGMSSSLKWKHLEKWHIILPKPFLWVYNGLIE